MDKNKGFGAKKGAVGMVLTCSTDPGLCTNKKVFYLVALGIFHGVLWESYILTESGLILAPKHRFRCSLC